MFERHCAPLSSESKDETLLRRGFQLFKYFPFLVCFLAAESLGLSSCGCKLVLQKRSESLLEKSAETGWLLLLLLHDLLSLLR